MGIRFLLEQNASLGKYVLVYSLIYIILAFLFGTFCFFILYFRDKSKKVNDLRYNISLSLTLSSTITCLTIPVITYFTQIHYNPFVAKPHTTNFYTFEVSLLYLYTLILPIIFFLLLAVASFIWHGHRRKVLLLEFNLKYAEKKSIVSSDESS